MLPSPLLIASRNHHKLREIRGILGNNAPHDLRDLLLHPEYVPPEESAPDYLGNARLKAHHAAEHFGLPALADDSGIEVDALGGLPGPRSARFAGDDATDALNNAELLSRLEGVLHPTARYRCVVVLAWPDGREIHAEGTCDGTIVREPRGHGGFGYDPHVELTGGRTMAELTEDEKNRISHRFNALRHLLDAIVRG